MLTLKKKYSSHPSIASIQKVSQKTWHTKHSFLHNCDLDKNRNIELNIFVLFVSKDTLRKVRKCWEKICIVSRGEMLININKMHGNMFPYCIKRRGSVIPPEEMATGRPLPLNTTRYTIHIFTHIYLHIYTRQVLLRDIDTMTSPGGFF